MATLDLTVACDLNDRTQALFTGDVQPSGIDLNMLTVKIEESAKRMAWSQEFDVAEMSMSGYITAASKPEDSGMIAIPVFPSRMFRHSALWINTESGVETMEDLRGADVGIPTFTMTAGLWLKGILSDLHDVGTNEINWYYGGQERSGRETTVEFDLPDDIHLEAIPPGATLKDMLEAGDLDAIVAPRAPSNRDAPTVGRLFPDYRAVEETYYEETGHFPIMHTVVLDAALYEEEPWIALELVKAFTEAKDRALDGLLETGVLKSSLPWGPTEATRTREAMGEDYWPYGVEPNRETLDTMIRYSHEQGLAERRIDVDELFAPTTLRDPTIT